MIKPEQRKWAIESQEKSKLKFSEILLNLYSYVKIRKYVLYFVRRTEGGDFFSQTLREIFAKYHNVIIGRYSYGCFSRDAFPPGTRIGAFVSVADNVYSLRRNHPHQRLSQHPFFYNKFLKLVKEDTIEENEDNPLVIENDVWIGCKSIILPGCKRIGNGAIIGAGSVVTKDVPDFAIVAGNPAKIIKWRFSEEVIAKIEKTAWWNYSIDQLIEADFPFVENVDEKLMDDFCNRLITGARDNQHD